MKTIPATLIEAYSKPGMSTCFLVRVKCKDGSIYGFTTLDANYSFNDGQGVLTYDAASELRPQAMQEEASFDVDNTDLLGWFDSTLEALVLSGKFDFAVISIYRIAYLRPEAGYELIAHGTAGRISFTMSAQGRRSLEFRSLKHQLQQTPNEVFSLTCRADFGDERCGMPLVWEAATVADVGQSAYLNLTLSGVTQPDAYFDLGVVEFLSGSNAGAEVEVESWTSGGVIQLAYLTPFAIEPGVSARIRRDCQKTATACKAYGNIRRMRAEHLTPASDQAIMVPGAYIKSQGAL